MSEWMTGPARQHGGFYVLPRAVCDYWRGIAEAIANRSWDDLRRVMDDDETYDDWVKEEIAPKNGGRISDQWLQSELFEQFLSPSVAELMTDYLPDDLGIEDLTTTLDPMMDSPHTVIETEEQRDAIIRILEEAGHRVDVDGVGLW